MLESTVVRSEFLTDLEVKAKKRKKSVCEINKLGDNNWIARDLENNSQLGTKCYILGNIRFKILRNHSVGEV